MRNICPAIANDKNQNRCVSIVSLANQIYKAQAPIPRDTSPAETQTLGGKRNKERKKSCGLREGEKVVIQTGANPNPGSITGERDEREMKWEAFHAVRNN